MIITKEWINTVAPKHDCISCSDDNLLNRFGGWNGRYSSETGKKIINFPRCSRCYLLDNLGMDTTELEFEVKVNVDLIFRDA